MSQPARRLPAVLLLLLLVACTLPGSASPTPFSFPTPDLTLTALVAPTGSPTPLIIASATPTISPSLTPFIPGTITAGPGTTTGVPDDPTATPGSQDGRSLGAPITAERLTTAPTIDGDLTEWTGSATAIDQVVFGATNWTGIDDVNGQFHIGWDEQALHLGVQVIDDTFVQVSSGRNMFRGDIVELQLDANLDGDFSSAFLSSDDYQLGLNPGNFGSIPPGAYRWYPIGLAGIPAGVTVRAVRTEDGYNLEARIPWTVVAVTPEEGDEFGFALSLSDNDRAGQALQQSMVSTVRTRKLTNPTTWGKLVLGP